MRKPRVLVPILLAAALAGVLAAHEPAPATPAGQIAVEVSFARGTDRPGQYSCEVTVKELGSGEVLYAPKILVLAGEPATVTSQDGDRHVEVTAFVAKDGGQVDLAVIVRRAGVKTAAQALTVKLPL